jgi:hypothetical protein
MKTLPTTFFREFLVSTNSLEAFKKAFETTSKYRKSLTADEFIGNYQLYDAANPIDVGIHWAATSQGATYWGDMNNMFYSLVNGAASTKNNKGFKYAEL